MKVLMTFLATVVSILVLTFVPPTVAQTPDGVTPANEGVCDALRDDGVTKGLFGLCIAFCEAQDITSVEVPITPDELEALEDKAPSGRILANYNRKKTATDPAMPCIKVEEPCPCWSSADLNELDGVMWDGHSSISSFVTEPGGRACFDSATTTNLSALEIERSNTGQIEHFTQAATGVIPSASFVFCSFTRNRNGPDGSTTQIQLSTSAGTLTAEQAGSCAASLRAFQANSGFCPSIQQ